MHTLKEVFSCESGASQTPKVHRVPQIESTGTGSFGTAGGWAPISIFLTWLVAVSEYGFRDGPAASSLAGIVTVKLSLGTERRPICLCVVEMAHFSCQQAFHSSVWTDREHYLNEILRSPGCLPLSHSALSK